MYCIYYLTFVKQLGIKFIVISIIELRITILTANRYGSGCFNNMVTKEAKYQRLLTLREVPAR